MKIDDTWSNRANFYQKLEKLIKKHGAKELLLETLSRIKTRCDSIEFELVTKYETRGIKETELKMEIDPLLTLDIFIRSIRMALLELEIIAIRRRNEILELRRKYRDTGREE